MTQVWETRRCDGCLARNLLTAHVGVSLPKLLRGSALVERWKHPIKGSLAIDLLLVERKLLLLWLSFSFPLLNFPMSVYRRTREHETPRQTRTLAVIAQEQSARALSRILRNHYTTPRSGDRVHVHKRQSARSPSSGLPTERHGDGAHGEHMARATPWLVWIDYFPGSELVPVRWSIRQDLRKKAKRST